MIDLTKITPEQANRIECALIALEGNIKEQIDGHKELANDTNLHVSTRMAMQSTAQWWEEVYNLIYAE